MGKISSCEWKVQSDTVIPEVEIEDVDAVQNQVFYIFATGFTHVPTSKGSSGSFTKLLTVKQG
jgi:hypothetical protein